MAPDRGVLLTGNLIGCNAAWAIDQLCISAERVASSQAQAAILLSRLQLNSPPTAWLTQQLQASLLFGKGSTTGLNEMHNSGLPAMSSKKGRH